MLPITLETHEVVARVADLALTNMTTTTTTTTTMMANAVSAAKKANDMLHRLDPLRLADLPMMAIPATPATTMALAGLTTPSS